MHIFQLSFCHCTLSSHIKKKSGLRVETRLSDLQIIFFWLWLSSFLSIKHQEPKLIFPLRPKANWAHSGSSLKNGKCFYSLLLDINTPCTMSPSSLTISFFNPLEYSPATKFISLPKLSWDHETKYTIRGNKFLITVLN